MNALPYLKMKGYPQETDWSSFFLDLEPIDSLNHSFYNDSFKIPSFSLSSLPIIPPIPVSPVSGLNADPPEFISSNRILLCSSCDLIFARESDLNLHKLVCTYMPKPEIDLIDSSASHEKKKFNCDQCLKSFTTKGHLKDHSRRHSGSRPYECECGARFMRSSTLTVHKRKHTGVRPYVCPYCQNSFTESGNLTVHLRIHTGDTPYKCPFEWCDRKFKTKGSLKEHLRSKLHS